MRRRTWGTRCPENDRRHLRALTSRDTSPVAEDERASRRARSALLHACSASPRASTTPRRSRSSGPVHGKRGVVGPAIEVRAQRMADRALRRDRFVGRVLEVARRHDRGRSARHHRSRDRAARVFVLRIRDLMVVQLESLGRSRRDARLRRAGHGVAQIGSVRGRGDEVQERRAEVQDRWGELQDRGSRPVRLREVCSFHVSPRFLRAPCGWHRPT